MINMSEVYFVRTRADFLNEKFGTNYKQYMRCTWKHPTDNYLVWMVFIDDERVDDYQNGANADMTKITEKFVGEKDDLDFRKKRKRFKTSAEEYPIRLVVKIEKSKKPNGKRQYIILGKYELSKRESGDLYEFHIWRKVD